MSGDRLLATTTTGLSDQQNVEDTLYLSQIDSIATATPFLKLATNSPGFGISQKAALADHFIAYEMAYQPIVVLDTGTKTWKSVPAAGGAEAVDPRVSGDDVFFTVLDSGGDDLWVRRADGSLDKLRDVASTHVVGFATDGTTLAWLQLSQPSTVDPSGYDHVELWTAPYTTSAAALAPKKLTTIPGPGWEAVTLMAHAGYAAYYANDVRVYRLSDGAYYTAPPPPIAGLTYGDVLWVDDTEVVVQLSDGVRGRTIARMKLADMTLHPPVP